MVVGPLLVIEDPTIWDFGFWILDLRYSIDFKKTERSDTTNPKSEIRNLRFQFVWVRCLC
ncbi:hypothetical protein D1AOALGA4SA_10519 [Olavius algarvensis Delta 1 endosymbiont]|nr:hypothetical protein D1AOALGA4SA_10519 [Olavius algarvensis Delta 1 endosymbiont]